MKPNFGMGGGGGVEGRTKVLLSGAAKFPVTALERACLIKILNIINFIELIIGYA